MSRLGGGQREWTMTVNQALIQTMTCFMITLCFEPSLVCGGNITWQYGVLMDVTLCAASYILALVYMSTASLGSPARTKKRSAT